MLNPRWILACKEAALTTHALGWMQQLFADSKDAQCKVKLMEERKDVETDISVPAKRDVRYSGIEIVCWW